MDDGLTGTTQRFGFPVDFGFGTLEVAFTPDVFFAVEPLALTTGIDLSLALAFIFFGLAAFLTPAALALAVPSFCRRRRSS